MLATIQAEGERNAANPEAVAVTGISMKMEFDGLVSPLPPSTSQTPPTSSTSPVSVVPMLTPQRLLQYSSIKELLTLSRKIKELWMFGPLGQDDQDQKQKEAQIDADVRAVAGLLDGMQARDMAALAERGGGSWAPLGGGEEDKAVPAQAEQTRAAENAR